jgi:DNA replication protein DnaC
MFYYRRSFCQCPAGQFKANTEADKIIEEDLQERIRQLNNESGLGKGLYAQYRFDKWDVSINAPYSTKAINAVRRYVETVSLDTNNWLFLYGDYGLGKTHLAIAALRAIALNNEWTARVAVWPELCQATKESWNTTHGLTEAQLWGRVRSARILLLDDLDKTATSEWAMGKLFDLVNQRSTRQLPTLITANHSPKQLQSDWRKSRHEHIRDTGLAVLSRIAQCLWGGVKFEGKDQRWSV